MNRIYTSYFANYRNFPKDCTKVSVARDLKQSIKVDICIEEFAPSKELLYAYKNGNIHDGEYTFRYLAELKNRDLGTIVNKLASIAQTNDVVLLCYEKKGKFCHRHILADCLNAYNFNVMEL